MSVLLRQDCIVEVSKRTAVSHPVANIDIGAVTRRRANNDEEDEYEEVGPSYLPPAARREGAPAFVRVSLKTFGVTGMIVDSESRLLPEKIFRYDALLENLLCRAINQYDSLKQTGSQCGIDE
ncbi:hypothetical protein GLAREA_07141 [Glarea lozoyensis ATCC 20868]|uniref:Uncharacterized protein n=1 Tax=Glarea lozoyensis (strain ATCC 20868 / MF5171) TaxID=1116229 RepID=S3E6Z2_GLAL2|nr:uncharacterized protein GLAREA_07141 [Glarea lozoyensis ATCC 20868]EPE34128.1 hypothetical protein GLAREA_07141 [Glarea lozoyensis ATCC 20868]